MRSSLIISVSLHLLVTLIAMNWVSFRQVEFVPRQVYAVDIVTAAEVQKEQKKTPPPKVEEPAPEPEPEEEPEEEMPPPPDNPKPVKKPKEKPRKTVPTTQLEKTEPAKETPEDTQPGVPETGEMAFDTDNFPFAHYISRMRRKIAAHWRVPEGSQGEDRFCVIYFRVFRDGTVVNSIVEQPSGFFVFDQAAERAVLQSSPMPPLPREYNEEYLGVHFSFAYKEER